MSRILLKELLSFTEQAPQPPAAGQPIQPPAPTPAAGQSPTPDAPAPEGDEPPSPDNPGEYDFTRDFKTFESTIEKAKQASKKKFLDKLNQMVKEKKVTVNASRGYGQPQKDYTIDAVSKASVDWYYNKNVVVLTDANGKEYFLTPGVNIKIEAAAPAAPEAPEAGADQAPTEPPKKAAPSPTPSAGQPTEPTPQAGQQPGAEAPPQPGAEQGQEQPAPEEPGQDPAALAVKKKKKPAPAPEAPMEEEDMGFGANKPSGDTGFGDGDQSYDKETVNRDFAPLFLRYIALPPGKRTLDMRQFFKSGTASGDAESWYSEVRFEVPTVLMRGFDPKDFQLDYKDEARQYGGPGQPFSRGSVDITKQGRFWVFEFYDSGGLDI